METIFLGKELITLQSVDSTNNYAAKMNKQGVLSDGSVIMAYNQENGRGQRGNSWHVAPNMNLTFSIFWKSSGILVSEQFTLSMAMSVGVINYLQHHNVTAHIKWPNDIYVGNKKIAGMLIENSLQGKKVVSSILGLGLNINQCTFEGINATSLSKLKGSKFDIVNELRLLLSFLEPELLKLRTQNLKPLKGKYFESLIGYQTSFKYKLMDSDHALVGIIKDVRDNGEIVIETNGLEQAFDLKEIVFIR